MTVATSVLVGASNAARRNSTMDEIRQPSGEYTFQNPNVSDAERLDNSVLDVAESPEFNYAVMGGTALYGASSAAGAAIAAGGGLGAASLSAGAALGQFAIVAGAGYLGFAAGAWLGDKAADALFGGLLGKQAIATEGDTPARLGDPIGHINKNMGLLGALIGAVAAIAITAFAVATFGAGLVVLAAAAAVSGLVAGTITSFASKAGQYGSNKGKIAEGSTNVYFNGKPVARTGDLIVCADHSGPQKLAEGAKTVYANNRNIVRVGHRTTCDGNVNGGSHSIIETMETAQVYEIKDSRWAWLRWANIIVNLLPLPRTKGKGATEATEGHGCQPGKCTKPGEPVDVGTGDFYQEWPLIDIPGTITLRLTRLYRSTADFSGSFGPKWADDWAQHLVMGDQTVTYHTAQGTTLVYHTPHDEVRAINLRDGRYQLFGRRTGILRLYDRRAQQVLSFGQPDGTARRLSTIEDLNGNRINFEYTAAGDLHRIVHSDGYELAVQMHARRIQSVHLAGGDLPDNALLRCDYDGRGFLAECASLQFGRLRHEYNIHGWMTHWRDTNKTSAYIQYDERGRVVSTRTASGHFADRFEYDDTAACTRYYDAEGGCTHYFYNRDGLVTRRIDPLGHEWRTEWDIGTNKLSETDPLGRIWRYAYNDFGDPVQVTGPDGLAHRYHYGPHGQLSRIELPNGSRWEFTHDAHANLTGVLDPYGRRTTYRIGQHGEILRQDNPNGTQLRFAYDEHLRLAGITHADGTASRVRLDVLGRALEVTAPDGQVTRYAYRAGHADPRQSASTITLPDGTQQHYAYDTERLVTAYTDGEGKTTRYLYGAFDLLQQQVSPGGNLLCFHYDRLTRLSGVTNGAGDTYRYEYDAAGRLVGETDYSGIVTRYAYDAAGALIEKHLADGSRTTYDYDRFGRLTTIRHWPVAPAAGAAAADPQTCDSETRFEYDAYGQLLRASNVDASVEYERDARGVVIAERINGREVRRRYDELTGAPIAQLAGHTVQWRYDVNGALIELGLEGHAPLSLLRDVMGRDVRRTSAAGFDLHQQYDPLGQLVAQQLMPSAARPASSAVPHAAPRVGLPDGQGGIERRYRYDRAFNPLQIDDRRWGTTRYAYDANDQVAEARFEAPGAAPLLDEYRYDRAHNLIDHTTLDRQRGLLRHSLAQQGGRVVQRGANRYRYDALGRLIEKRETVDGFRPQTWHYRWNGENRLIELITPQGERWRYTYDPFGRRVSKTRVDGTRPRANGANDANIIGEQYLWCGDQLIEAAPVYADGTVAFEAATRWLYAPGGLVPLAQQQGGRLWYIVTDHLGTPRELVSETGEVAWANRPTTWGRQHLWRRRAGFLNQSAANDDDITCPIRFIGQFHDPESGLHYNRHRYYDPDTGQYLSPDPLGLKGGFRPQGYVDNPNGWVDPLGLKACLGNASVSEQESPAAGQISFMEGNDRFLKNASNRSDIDQNGFFDVIAHGSPQKIQVQAANGPVLVNHRIAARLIQQAPGYSGQNIRLLSCSTGASDVGFAQNLANKLGVKVQAPNDLLWAYPDGSMIIAPQGINGPDLAQVGKFHIFNPGKF